MQGQGPGSFGWSEWVSVVTLKNPRFLFLLELLRGKVQGYRDKRWLFFCS